MPYKVLIVEDNENNRSLLGDILTYYGYEVSVAADGQQGVDLASRRQTDEISDGHARDGCDV